MLTYEEFKDLITENILDYLPDEYADCEVTVVRTLKNNGMALDGLLIRNERFNISPNIYLSQFYEEYEEGETVEAIMEKIAALRLRSEYRKDIDASKLMEFKNVRNHLYLSFVNYDLNSEFLAERPYRKCLDLAIIYYIDIMESGVMKVRMPGNLSLGITNDLMEEYGVDEQTLYEVAMNNMRERKDVELRFIHDEIVDRAIEHKARREGVSRDCAEAEVMASFDAWDYNIMYLTNKKHDRGAALILREDVRDDLVRTFDGGYYIIPSSIHEVILISEKTDIPINALRRMVKDVNGDLEDKREFLSDSIYYYDAGDGELKLVA